MCTRLNSCCEIVESLDTLRNTPPRETELHKEDMKSRIRKDQIDRQVLRTKIENSIAIFETNQHPKDGLGVTHQSIDVQVNVN